MTCGFQYTQRLHSRGFRMTPQRLAIVHILHDTGGHLSPSQIFERAQQIIPGLTEATVYRTLVFLAQNDLVYPAYIGNGKLVYEIAGHDHHHLICRGCGRSVEVDHSLLETQYNQLQDVTGYRLTDCHVTFFGLCPECQKKHINMKREN